MEYSTHPKQPPSLEVLYVTLYIYMCVFITSFPLLSRENECIHSFTRFNLSRLLTIFFRWNHALLVKARHTMRPQWKLMHGLTQNPQADIKVQDHIGTNKQEMLNAIFCIWLWKHNKKNHRIIKLNIIYIHIEWKVPNFRSLSSYTWKMTLSPNYFSYYWELLTMK